MSERIDLARLRALAEGNGEAEFEDRIEVVIGGPEWADVLALVEAVTAAQALPQCPLCRCLKGRGPTVHPDHFRSCPLARFVGAAGDTAA